MNRLLFVSTLAIAAVLVSALPGSADAKDTAKDEKELLQIERDWAQAAVKNDTATMAKLLGDDYIWQGPAGAATKAEMLADLKSGDTKIESMTLGDMKVRIFGDAAIVIGSDDEKSSYKGKDTSGHYTWIDVYAKRKGHWHAVATQATLMPPTK